VGAARLTWPTTPTARIASAVPVRIVTRFIE
jgi:hypothetical protein